MVNVCATHGPLEINHASIFFVSPCLVEALAQGPGASNAPLTSMTPIEILDSTSGFSH